MIGKNGQVGSELARVLPRLGDLISLDRQHLDLSRPDDIRSAVREARPQFIVNAAAYTAVDQAEKDETAARTINTEAPAVMAEEAKKIDSVLVHYSTDYVFDGTKNSPYAESDPTNPLNVYGSTKLAGEQAIRDSGADHLIFAHRLGLCNERPKFPVDDASPCHPEGRTKNCVRPDRCAYMEPRNCESDDGGSCATAHGQSGRQAPFDGNGNLPPHGGR